MEKDSMKKIQIPRKPPRKPVNRQGIIRITSEAADALDEAARETALSVKQVASLIIINVVKNGLIEYIGNDLEGVVPEEEDTNE